MASLNKTISRSMFSSLYQNKLAGHNTEIANKRELQALPFTTSKELRDSYPCGSLAVGMRDVIEVHTTSGTTGSPAVSFFTKNDLANGSRAISKAWKCFGINEESRVQFIMSYGLFSGAMLNTFAIQELGAFVLPSGLQSSFKQLELMRDFQIDTVVATPGYLAYLYECLKTSQIKREDLCIKRAVAAGEIYSEDLRKEIEEKWQIKVFDHYGLCEVNTGIAYECEARQGLHLLEDYVVAEVVSPEGEESLPPGKVGELVLTTLQKEASPVIRYRTGDITCLLDGECPCGRKARRIGRIKRRVDDLVFVKGTKVDPHELKSLVWSLVGGEVQGSDFQLRIKSGTTKFVPEVVLSLRNPDNSTIDRLQEEIKRRTGLRFKVTPVEQDFFNRDGNTKVKIVEYV